MSELPKEQDELIQAITGAQDHMTGAYKREAARARLDALLAKEFTASMARLSTGIEQATRVVGESLAEVAGELVRTRKQMAESAATASRHQRGLVWCTVVLSVATVAYAVAAFLPLFLRPAATSIATEGAWVLWQMDTRPISQPPGWAQKFYTVLEAFPREAKGHSSGREMAAELCEVSKLYDEQTRGKESHQFLCLPETVDPRGPKGK